MDNHIEHFSNKNPNAVDSKVTVEFDHVKNGLILYGKELKKINADPAYNINVSGDIKHMLASLGTEKAKEIASLGGGGDKARNERAPFMLRRGKKLMLTKNGNQIQVLQIL